MAVTATSVDPERAVEESRRWARPLVEVLGEGFVALYLYGSALEPGYDPARSDVNLLLVARALPATQLRALAEAWPRRDGPLGAPANLVAMTAEQLGRAVDTFALEIREVQVRGRLVAGEDLLAGLVVPEVSLRHHLERELRVLVVRLRRVYLEGRDRDAALIAALADGVGTVVACARGLAYLEGSTVGLGATAALEHAAARSGVEPRPWLEAWRLRHEGPPAAAAAQHYLDFLDATAALMQRVDRHEGQGGG